MKMLSRLFIRDLRLTAAKKMVLVSKILTKLEVARDTAW